MSWDAYDSSRCVVRPAAVARAGAAMAAVGAVAVRGVGGLGWVEQCSVSCCQTAAGRQM